jgi:hypothetical protein
MNSPEDSLTSRLNEDDVLVNRKPPEDTSEATTPAVVAPDADPAVTGDTPVEPVAEEVLPAGKSDDVNEDEDTDAPPGPVVFANDKIDFRGERIESLVELLAADDRTLGEAMLNTKLRTIGSWENIVLRAIQDRHHEEERIQQALADLSPDDRKSLSHQLLDPNTKKTLLKTSSFREPIESGRQVLSGDAALLAFEFHESGGGYRIPLYNSGITLDVMVPTGNDIQTLLHNCTAVEEQLGSSLGAHYFLYNDLVYKNQILNFLYPLIVNSSYSDWRKRDKLFSIMKLPDLGAVVATLAAICWKDGFEGFEVKCTRPVSAEHPMLCQHTETLTVNIFNMILSRFSVMSTDTIEYMTDIRMNAAKRNLNAIAKYQADLGFEGERILIDGVTFVMKIPTVAEHGDAGSKFIADIINEIEGDNTNGYYEQFGFRYIRTFLPWISSIEIVTADGDTIVTSEEKVIIRQMEKIDQGKTGSLLRDSLMKYIGKVQLTYVGYPVLPCTLCGHVGDTPSGLWTFDPFNAFFTLAFLSLRQAA